MWERRSEEAGNSLKSMISQPTYPPRYCHVCGKPMTLTRHGTYRRHLVTSESGEVRNCPASRRSALTPAELARPKLP